MSNNKSLGIQRGNFEWTLDLKNLDVNGFSSRRISIENIIGCKFFLVIRKSPEPPVKNFQEVVLTIEKTCSRATKADVTVSFDNSDGSVKPVKAIKQIGRWIKRCDFNEFRIPVDKFTESTIKCEMTWYGPTDIAEAPSPPNLHDEIENFLFKSSLSDVKIIIDNEEILAHKLILGAHSPVFLSMFESDMREAKENRIVIHDIGVDVMKNVLSFLYTGSDDSLADTKMTLKVLVVAERYDIRKLKDLCEHKLCNQLTVVNVLEILDYAETYNAERLKEKCFKFFTENKKEVVKNEAFETLCLSQPKLMFLFLKNVIEE